MQAWSTSSRTHGGGGTRPTQGHPTKAGVVGFIANALGRDRTDDMTDLAGLTFAVRCDQPGRRSVDYHTAGSGHMPLLPGDLVTDPSLAAAVQKDHTIMAGWYGAPEKVKATPRGPHASISNRRTVVTVDEYLADAWFVAAFTGPAPLIEQISAALERPARQLFLGRKAYAPTGRILIGVTGDQCPHEALFATKKPGSTTIWADTTGNGAVTHDVPHTARTFTGRKVATTHLDGTDFFAPPGATP